MVALRYVALLCLASVLLVGAVEMDSSQPDSDANQDTGDVFNEMTDGSSDTDGADDVVDSEDSEEDGDGEGEGDDDDQDDDDDYEDGDDFDEDEGSEFNELNVHDDLPPAMSTQVNPRAATPGDPDAGMPTDLDMAEVEEEVEEMKTSGPTYVRWGRSTCPSSATLVYNGSAGGQYFGHPGGASNPLCLPAQPKYDKFSKLSMNYLYGAEYQIHGGSKAPLAYSQYHDMDVPCAVCMATGKSSTIMMPARNDCPAKWHVEYAGYLMSGHYGHPGREQFTCVDRQPEGIANSKRNTDGYLFYTVGVWCGLGIKCSPSGYVHRQELTCAICSH